jgi:hydroxyethylthiazole kinase-like uncharacterized protein yjeF
MEMITQNRVALLLPRRPRTGHKGAFGKLLIVAGSCGMAGAAVLSARGALRSGAGLVRVSIGEDLFPIIQTGIVEATCVSRDFNTMSAASALADCDAAVVGPGLGLSASAAKTVQDILNTYGFGVGGAERERAHSSKGAGGHHFLAGQHAARQSMMAGDNASDPASAVLADDGAKSKTMMLDGDTSDPVSAVLADDTKLKAIILDADALNLIARREVRLAELPDAGRSRLILTPHTGEAARLLACSPAEINRDRSGAAAALARQYGAVVVLKGHETLISEAGSRTYVNPTGNPGMATAGSGDVLSGIIAAFAGQGMNALDAACAGVYVHGFAGDMVSAEIGEYGLTASDIASAVPKAILRIQKTRNKSEE